MPCCLGFARAMCLAWSAWGSAGAPKTLFAGKARLPVSHWLEGKQGKERPMPCSLAVASMQFEVHALLHLCRSSQWCSGLEGGAMAFGVSPHGPQGLAVLVTAPERLH